nr:MAG TPA: hypothetical protein [Caudoviricetes sp.]
MKGGYCGVDPLVVCWCPLLLVSASPVSFAR